MDLPLRLHDHARPLRRGPGELQLGLSTEGGLLLRGLCEEEIALVLLLRQPVSPARWHASATAAGVPAARAQELLALLRSVGALVTPRETPGAPAGRVAPLAAPRGAAWGRRASVLAGAYRLAGDGVSELGARRDRTVIVQGAGTLADLVEQHLRHAGMGTVVEDDLAGPDLAVLVGRYAVTARSALRWQDAGVAHLPVVVLGRTIVVGPLVLPGAGPCLGCVERHRVDRDPWWPQVLAQLVLGEGDAAPDVGGSPVETDPVLAAAGAAVTAMVAQAHLDGLAVPPGLSWEVALPWPEVSTRLWVPHPACECASRRADPGWAGTA